MGAETGAGAGSDAGGGISGSGSSRTFCILLRAAFFSISRSFTVIVYPTSGGGGKEI